MTIFPGITTPLVDAPNQPTPLPLGVLSTLVGTWNSSDLIYIVVQRVLAACGIDAREER